MKGRINKRQKPVSIIMLNQSLLKSFILIKCLTKKKKRKKEKKRNSHRVLKMLSRSMIRVERGGSLHKGERKWVSCHI